MTLPRLLLIAVALVFGCAACVDANPYETVKSATEFAIGGVGVAGTISNEELAMRAIRDSADADAKFRQLLRDSMPAGQMYALFGLRQMDARDYPQLADPLRTRSTPVRVVSGCIIHTDRMSQVVEWIDKWAKQSRTWEKN